MVRWYLLLITLTCLELMATIIDEKAIGNVVPDSASAYYWFLGSSPRSILCTSNSDITTRITKGKTKSGWILQDIFGNPTSKGGVPVGSGVGCPGIMQVSRIGFALGKCTSTNDKNVYAIFSADMTANIVTAVYAEYFATRFCNTNATSVETMTTASGTFAPTVGSFNASCNLFKTTNNIPLYQKVSWIYCPLTLSLPIIPTCVWSSNLIWFSSGFCSGSPNFFEATCSAPSSTYCQASAICQSYPYDDGATYMPLQNIAGCPNSYGLGCTDSITCKVPPGAIGRGYVINAFYGVSGCKGSPINIYPTSLGVCTLLYGNNGIYGMYYVLPSTTGGFSRLFVETYIDVFSGRGDPLCKYQNFAQFVSYSNMLMNTTCNHQNNNKFLSATPSNDIDVPLAPYGATYIVKAYFSGAGCTGVLLNSSICLLTTDGYTSTSKCQISPSTGNYNLQTTCTAPSDGQCVNGGYEFVACPKNGLLFPRWGNPITLQAWQWMSCANGCVLTGWNTAQNKLMTITFQNALRASLQISLIAYNTNPMAVGNVTVNGFSQVSNRRKLLIPTITVTYTVSVNDPYLQSSDCIQGLFSATSDASFLNALAKVTGSSVTMSYPTLISVNGQVPTRSPSYRNAGTRTMHDNAITTVTLAFALVVGLFIMLS